MNRKLLLSLIAVLLLATGCVIGPGSRSGDVTFTWTFQGQSCSQASVATVVIQIPGETLENSGSYNCMSNGYPGIVLHNFRPGTYDFTIDAYDTHNVRLFTKNGTFTVNGDVDVTVDLATVGGGTSYAYLNWRFPANAASTDPTCTQAGVTTVGVQIDSGPVNSYPCAEGFSSPGRQTPLLAPGAHSIWIGGYDSTGYLLYSYSGTLTTVSGTPSFQQYTLGWAVGGMVLTWQLSADDGVTTQSCAQAGITTLYVNFEAPDGTMLYGDRANISSWDVQSCDQAYVDYAYLPPGTYKIFITGAGTSGNYYSANWFVPSDPMPSTTITAGVFPTPAQAVSVMLYLEP